MRKLCKKMLPIILMLAAMITILAPVAFAADAAATVTSLSEGGTNIICIAHRGDWHSFPENSVEAINAALDCDAVSVDVKLTSDEKPVLMADDTVDRMCISADGRSAFGEVSSFTLAKIKELYLRGGNGGADKVKTDFRVAELKEAYAVTKGKAALFLNISEDDFQTVYAYVKTLGKLNETVFRINAKAKRIAKLTQGLENVNAVGRYQGNIIFLATGAARVSFKNGINTVELGSINSYSVLFKNYMMSRFTGNRRAMISMVTGLCGNRPDSESGWDDLISRGYSVIETNYPTELLDYIKRTEAAAAELKNDIDLYGNTNLASYTTESERTFNTALEEANELLLKPSSFSDLTDARTAFLSAHSSLTVGEKKPVTLEFNFSFGRIVAVTTFAAAVVVGSLFLHKRRSPAEEEAEEQ